MLGVHLIGIISGRSSTLRLGHLDKKCRESALQNGLTVVKKTKHVFGLRNEQTICYILSQSHLIIHTWPEKNQVAFDLFTCGPKHHALGAIKHIAVAVNGKVERLRAISL